MNIVEDVVALWTQDAQDLIEDRVQICNPNEKPVRGTD